MRAILIVLRGVVSLAMGGWSWLRHGQAVPPYKPKEGDHRIREISFKLSPSLYVVEQYEQWGVHAWWENVSPTFRHFENAKQYSKDNACLTEFDLDYDMQYQRYLDIDRHGYRLTDKH